MPLYVSPHDGLQIIKGDLRIEETAPQLQIRDTGQAVDNGGLWRLIAGFGAFQIQMNTAAGGDFSSVAERFYIDPSGYIGLHQTGASANGMVNITGNTDLFGTLRVKGIDNPGALGAGTGLELRYTGTVGSILGYNRLAAARIPVVIDSSRAEIATGNLGVQNSQARYPLDVGGSAAAASYAGSGTILGYFSRAGELAVLFKNTTATVEGMIAVGSSSVAMGTSTNHNFILATQNSNRMQITGAGVVEVQRDTDTMAYIGRTAIGRIDGTTDHAGIYHVDQIGTVTNYGFGINNTGTVLVNAPTGQTGMLRINNTTVLQWSAGVVQTTGEERVSGSLAVGLSSAATLSATPGIDINGSTIRLRTARAPATSAAAGNQGECCWSNAFWYVCVATNTWRRVALVAF